ncbi:hypothetical protein JXM67_01420 [candidate division WOR-3 bacterium]|nr:hypothetical protein [candidate division WOR-3 bacterium]
MPNIPSSGKTPSDQDRLLEQELFDKVNELQQRLMLSGIRSAVENAERAVIDAERNLSDVRNQGHRFDADLDGSLKRERTNFDRARDLLNRRYDDINRTLRPELDSVMQQLEHASVTAWNVASLRRRIERCETELVRIEKELESSIRSALSPLEELCLEIKGLAWAYRQIEEASFKKEEGEELVSAWEAQWLEADGKSGPWGVLYLTTKRLIFEQKEKVKTGGFFSKKELRQRLGFWQMLEDLERSLDKEERRFLSYKELLDLEFRKGDPLKATIRFRQDSNTVDRRIEDLVAGRLKTQS